MRKRLYLRHSVRRKKGRSHTYWRLVRSVRLLTWSREMQTRVTSLGRRFHAHGFRSDSRTDWITTLDRKVLEPHTRRR